MSERKRDRPRPILSISKLDQAVYIVLNQRRPRTKAFDRAVRAIKAKPESK